MENRRRIGLLVFIHLPILPAFGTRRVEEQTTLFMQKRTF